MVNKYTLADTHAPGQGSDREMSELTRQSAKLPPEQAAIRAKCFHPTGTFVEFPKDEIERSIPGRLEKIVRQYPERLAVKTKDRSLTYGELNQAANRIAHAILAKRGQGSEPIALLLENDASMIAAILGVLKAGKIYVPMGPSLPRARIAHMLEDSQAALLLTDRKNLVSARELAQDESLLMNIDESDAGISTENSALSISPDHLAYIVYTSGSTGQPKGVLQNHRNGLHEAMLYANGLHISPEDRLALLYSCSASQGMKIAFGALLNGAALCPYDLKEEGVGNLAAWFVQEEITICFSIPIVFRQFVGTLTGQEKFPRLRLIQLGSDSVTLREVEGYKKHYSPDTILVVRLGSTEAGTLRRYFCDGDTPLKGKMVPVGYPVEDMEVSLIDEEGKKVGFNRVGEIAVTSRYLSPGYWRMADLTRAKFLPDPNGGDKRIYLTGDLGRMLSDGCLYHLGRKDFQVEVRGYRIEVAEIEMALLSLGIFKEVIVVPLEDHPREQRLVAYLVLTSQTTVTVSTLRRSLSEKLPDYMIPSNFVLLDALPLTPNGKVNRRALPLPALVRPELDTPFVSPRTAFEETVAAIWAETLGLDRVGIHDNFLDLGGNSLVAARIISRVFNTFRVQVPLPLFFGAPTVADMAAVITENQGKQLGEGELGLILAELELMSEEDVRTILSGSKPADPGGRT
jgi:amino acid adenylation domain-containing protein